MAASVIFADGFETYGTGLTTAVQDVMLAGAYVAVGRTGASNSGTVGSGARTGTNYYKIDTSSADWLRRVVTPSRAQVAIAVGVQFGDFNDSDLGIVFLTSGGSPICNFRRNTDGTWTAIQGDYNDTALGTSIVGMNVDAWHHIEVKVVVDGASSTYELRLDGDVILSGTGNFGSSNVASIALGSRDLSFSASNTNMLVDDLVIHDGASFIGPARVRTYYADADGSPSDWTPTGAASAYEAVDDTTPDDDTTYIEAANANDQQVLAIPTVDSEISDVIGIYVGEYSRQASAGTTNIRVDILSGAANEQGSARPLTPSYSYGGAAFSTDPNTSGAIFTKTTLEAASIRIVRTA